MPRIVGILLLCVPVLLHGSPAPESDNCGDSGNGLNRRRRYGTTCACRRRVPGEHRRRRYEWRCNKCNEDRIADANIECVNDLLRCASSYVWDATALSGAGGCVLPTTTWTTTTALSGNGGSAPTTTETATETATVTVTMVATTTTTDRTDASTSGGPTTSPGGSTLAANATTTTITTTTTPTVTTATSTETSTEASTTSAGAAPGSTSTGTTTATATATITTTATATTTATTATATTGTSTTTTTLYPIRPEDCSSSLTGINRRRNDDWCGCRRRFYRATGRRRRWDGNLNTNEWYVEDTALLLCVNDRFECPQGTIWDVTGNGGLGICGQPPTTTTTNTSTTETETSSTGTTSTRTTLTETTIETSTATTTTSSSITATTSTQSTTTSTTSTSTGTTATATTTTVTTTTTLFPTMPPSGTCTTSNINRRRSDGWCVCRRRFTRASGRRRRFDFNNNVNEWYAEDTANLVCNNDNRFVCPQGLFWDITGNGGDGICGPLPAGVAAETTTNTTTTAATTTLTGTETSTTATAMPEATTTTSTEATETTGIASSSAATTATATATGTSTAGSLATTAAATTAAATTATTTATATATATAATTGTTTATTAATTTATAAATTATTTQPPANQVTGALYLSVVPDPESFVADPAAKQTFASAIADLVGVPPESVVVVITLVRGALPSGGRRLRELSDAGACPGPAALSDCGQDPTLCDTYFQCLAARCVDAAQELTFGVAFCGPPPSMACSAEINFLYSSVPAGITTAQLCPSACQVCATTTTTSTLPWVVKVDFVIVAPPELIASVAATVETATVAGDSGPSPLDVAVAQEMQSSGMQGHSVGLLHADVAAPPTTTGTSTGTGTSTTATTTRAGSAQPPLPQNLGDEQQANAAGGPIIGAVMGGLVGLFAMVGAGVALTRRWRRRKEALMNNGEGGLTSEEAQNELADGAVRPDGEEPVAFETGQEQGTLPEIPTCTPRKPGTGQLLSDQDVQQQEREEEARGAQVETLGLQRPRQPSPPGDEAIMEDLRPAQAAEVWAPARAPAEVVSL